MWRRRTTLSTALHKGSNGVPASAQWHVAVPSLVARAFGWKAHDSCDFGAWRWTTPVLSSNEAGGSLAHPAREAARDAVMWRTAGIWLARVLARTPARQPSEPLYPKAWASVKPPDSLGCSMGIGSMPGRAAVRWPRATDGAAHQQNTAERRINYCTDSRLAPRRFVPRETISNRRVQPLCPTLWPGDPRRRLRAADEVTR